jgi:phage-related protein (TIGR01555 family)
MRAKTKKRIAKDAIFKQRKSRDPNGIVNNRAAFFDYFQNMLARTGYGTPSLPEATTYEMVRLSNNYWLMLTLYRNHWLCRRIVDIPAIDMTRAWPKLVCDVPPEEIQVFDRTIQRTLTPQRVRQAIKWARLYGGGGALIAIKGHEKYLDEPLDLDDVNPDSYLGLIPFDRWVGIVPTTGEISQDLTHPEDWGLPQFYEVRAPDTGTSFKVHCSRILRFVGGEVPTPEFQAQMYWGISYLEVAYEELRKRDNASWAILNLLFRANLIAQVNPELAQILSGLGSSTLATQRFQQVMQAQNEMMSNQSMLVLGKDADLKSIQYTFGGIQEVYAQFQMDVAGAAHPGIPVTRLFGRTITGLGQANDADERLYEEAIASCQEEELHPQMNKLYPVIAMSEWGEVPDDLDLVFPSIRVMTEPDKADLVDKASAPILAAFNSGVIGRKTALKELRQLGDNTNIFTNITDEEIDSAEEEPELPGEGAIGENMTPEGAMRKESKGASEDKAMDARALHKRLKWHGLDVSIENQAGSMRHGTYPDGKLWAVMLTYDYGYIRMTTGVDGDHVDCFMGPDPTADQVYVVHTKKAPLFVEDDEDKCMLDFHSAAEAQKAFLANYDRPEHFGTIDKIPVGQFIDKVLATKEAPEVIR